MAGVSQAHVILVTHTPERIRRTLLGVSCQSHPVASVTVTCDTDDQAIRDEAVSVCNEFDMSLTLVRRARAELPRPAQTRNNALRTLIERGASDHDVVVSLDGDCVPACDAVAEHVWSLGRGELSIGWRFDLSPEQDAAFDEDRLRAGGWPIEPTPAQREELEKRRKKLVRQAWQRCLGIGKKQKPKLLGGNFAIGIGTLKAINGLDETFEGWGQEDDDLARRVYTHGGRPVVGAGRIHAFHQYHKTRALGEWKDNPTAARLGVRAPAWCAHGLVDPLDQAEVLVEAIG